MIKSFSRFDFKRKHIFILLQIIFADRVNVFSITSNQEIAPVLVVEPKTVAGIFHRQKFNFFTVDLFWAYKA